MAENAKLKLPVLEVVRSVYAQAKVNGYGDDNIVGVCRHQRFEDRNPLGFPGGLKAESFEALRERVLVEAVRRDTLREEVATMRKRMRAELSSGTQALFDIKQDAGGIADIEFMVQYLLLRYSSDYPALCHYSDNIRQLEALEEAQLLDEHLAERLAGIYRVLRAAHHRYSLQEKPAIIPADELMEERHIVHEAWELLMHAPPSMQEKA